MATVIKGAELRTEGNAVFYVDRALAHNAADPRLGVERGDQTVTVMRLSPGQAERKRDVAQKIASLQREISEKCARISGSEDAEAAEEKLLDELDEKFGMLFSAYTAIDGPAHTFRLKGGGAKPGDIIEKLPEAAAVAAQ